MSLLPDIAVACLRDEDTDEIVALYDRATVTEPGIGPVSATAWRRFVRLPHNANGRDFRVVRHVQRLIAVAESSLKDQCGQAMRFCKFVVDSDYRRQGVATALLAELLKIDQPDDELSFQFLASNTWLAALEFLKAFGFTPIESEIGMMCTQLKSLSVDMSSAARADRVFNPSGYAADVALIHNAAYRDDVAFRAFTTEEMASFLEGSELWAVRDGSRVVGFCHLEHEPKLVWLESLAVVPDYQGGRLATLLAQRALKEAGVDAGRPAYLNVSSQNTRAISIYERLGFVQRRERLRFSARQNSLMTGVASRLYDLNSPLG